LNSAIDSNYRSPNATYTAVISIPENGIRVLDGAGINQYANEVSTFRDFTVEASQAENATLSLSKDATSPKADVLIADSDGVVDNGTMLVLALRAEKGTVKITDITATTTGGATVSALYLYDGSDLLSSAAVSGSNATFSDLTSVSVAKDETKLLTIKAKFTGATTSTVVTSTVAVETGGIIAERIDTTTFNVGGSTATSAVMRVTQLSPVLNFVSAPANYTGPTESASGTLTGIFTFDITAGGGDVWISSSTANGVAFTVPVVDSDGAATTTNVAMTFSQPSNTTVDGTTGTYKIAKSQKATFVVNVAISSTNLSNGYYYFKLSNVDWGADSSGTGGEAISYLDSTVWRTNTLYVSK